MEYVQRCVVESRHCVLQNTNNDNQGKKKEKNKPKKMSKAQSDGIESFLGLKSKEEVSIEKLDYKYIEDCQDWKEVKKIFGVLLSGKEGHWPELERKAEERMLELMPEAEKTKYLRLRSNPTVSDEQEAARELQDWLHKTVEMDQLLKNKQSKSQFPPIRGSKSEVIIPQRIDAKDVPHFSNDEEKAQWELRNKRRKKLSELRLPLDLDQIPFVERKLMSERERVKGNESFRAGDIEEAKYYYSRSLELDSSDARVFANRALTYIRLKNFTLAEQDCDSALNLEPNYTKALIRRGTARHHRANYEQAIQDFHLVLEMEPNNTEVRKLLSQSENKFKEQSGFTSNPKLQEKTGDHFKRVVISESDGESDDETEHRDEHMRRVVIQEDSDDENDDSSRVESSFTVSTQDPSIPPNSEDVFSSAQAPNEEVESIKAQANTFYQQGLFNEAISQYNAAISLCPQVSDELLLF